MIKSATLEIDSVLEDRRATPPPPARAVFQITGAEQNLPFVGEPT